MIDFVPSEAAPDDIAAYTTACSHILAVAMHRHFGWRFLVVNDSVSPFYLDPADPANSIPSVVHVYAMDDNGDLWDVRGKRPQERMRDDMYALFNVQDFWPDVCVDEKELANYVGCWADYGEPRDRPLSEYSEGDVAEAVRVIERAFPHVPAVDAFIEAAPPAFRMPG